MKITTKEAFEELFRSNYDRLVNYAIRLVRDTEASEDLVQSVFVTLWDRREQIEINESVSSYLLRSTHNACLNYIKHQKVKQNHADQVLYDSDDASFVDVLESEEMRERIHGAVKDLPKACRRIFLMSRLQGKKYKQIAEELNISEKTVENQMGKALKLIRSSLSDEVKETMRVLKTILWLSIGVNVGSIVIR